MNILPRGIESWFLSLLLQEKEKFFYRMRSAAVIALSMKGLEVALVIIEYVSAKISLSDGFPFLEGLLLLRQIRIIDRVRIEGKGLSFGIPIDTVVFLKLID